MVYNSVAQWICHVKLTLLHITMDYHQTVILYWMKNLTSSYFFFLIFDKSRCIGYTKNKKENHLCAVNEKCRMLKNNSLTGRK